TGARTGAARRVPREAAAPRPIAPLPPAALRSRVRPRPRARPRTAPAAPRGSRASPRPPARAGASGPHRSPCRQSDRRAGSGAAPEIALARGRRQQLAHLFLEGRDIGKVAVHRSEADVSHLIQRAQLLHHQLADGLGRHFQPLTAPQLGLDLLEQALDSLRAHWPLRARLGDAVAELGTIELLAAPILL